MYSNRENNTNKLIQASDKPPLLHEFDQEELQVRQVTRVPLLLWGIGRMPTSVITKCTLQASRMMISGVCFAETCLPVICTTAHPCMMLLLLLLM